MKRLLSHSLAFALVLCTLVAPARAQGITVFAAASLRDALGEIAGAYPFEEIKGRKCQVYLTNLY